MKNQILELAKRHNMLSWDAVDKCYKITGDIEELAEFADSIVRKCAKVADLADQNECESIGSNVLLQFGVRP